MLAANEQVFEEIWTSNDYGTVFCTLEEKEQYLHWVGSQKVIPRGMSIVLIKRKLNRPYTKTEITRATPDQLRAMIG